MRPLIAALDSAGVSRDLGKAGTPAEQVVKVVGDETVSVLPNKAVAGQLQKKMFEFERVYSQDATQGFVFEDFSPLLTSLLDGYNYILLFLYLYLKVITFLKADILVYCACSLTHYP